MTVPTRCWITSCRTDCFCPEKSPGTLHLCERAAVKEAEFLNEEFEDVAVYSVVPCIIMPEETFNELCPDWRQPEEEEER